MTTLLQMLSVGAVLRRIVQAYCTWGLVEYHTFAGKADRWYRSVKQHDTDTHTQRPGGTSKLLVSRKEPHRGVQRRSEILVDDQMVTSLKRMRALMCPGFVLSWRL